MKLKALIAATVLAAIASAPFTASAQDALTGDTKLACEAVLCLASPTRPAECAAAIAKYFSISLRRFSSTLRARKNFLSLCPRVDPSAVEQVVNSNPPEPDPPEPAPVSTPTPTPTPTPVTTLNRTQIETRIAELVPIWEAQAALSTAARDVVEQCVLGNGRVQDGFCGPEMEDYNAKRLPAIASRDEIYRLQDLLASLDCSSNRNVTCQAR
jgi:hypothetical protein